MALSRRTIVQLLLLVSGIGSFTIGTIFTLVGIIGVYYFSAADALLTLVFLASGASAIAAFISLLKRMRQYSRLSLLAAIFGVASIVFTVAVLGFPSFYTVSLLSMFAVILVLWSWGALSIIACIVGRATSALATTKPTRGKPAKSWFMHPGSILVMIGAALIMALSASRFFLALYQLNAILSPISSGSFPLLPNASSPLIGLSYSNLLSVLGINLAVGFALPAISLVCLYLARRENRKSLRTYLLPIAVVTVLAVYIVPQVLLNNVTILQSFLSFTGSLSFGLVSGISQGSAFQAIGYGLGALFLAASVLLLIGVVLTVKPNRKVSAGTLVGAVAALIILSVISQYAITTDNLAAVQSLNGYIGTWNYNVQYLISNYSAFNDTAPNNLIIYNELAAKTTPNQSIGTVLSDPIPGGFNSYNYSSATEKMFDWGAYNPFVNIYSKATLYSLGVLPTGFLPPYGISRLSEPRSILYNLYSVLTTGDYILYTAVQLGDLFGCGYFGPVNNNTTFAPFSSGSSFIGYGPASLGSITATSITGYGVDSTYALSGISSGWLDLSTMTGSMTQLLKEGSITCKYHSNTVNGYNYTKALTIQQLFYGLSLNQNLADYDTSTYFGLNATDVSEIKPSVGYISYRDNYTTVDINLLKLSDPGTISLYIDNRSVPYIRYYNFLVAQGNLGVGLHNVLVDINGSNFTEAYEATVYPKLTYRIVHLSNLSINGTVYVSPGEMTTPQLQNTNFTFSIASILPLNITNLTVMPSYAIDETGYDVPLQSNVSEYNATTNTAVVVTTLQEYCNFGTKYVYNVTFDSEYGPGRYTAIIGCT